MTRVKICCIQNRDEAKLAIKYGASALGLVSEMPSGPGVIDEEEIKKIAHFIPPGVDSVLLTSKQDIKSIIEQQKRLGVNAIQIVDDLILGTHKELKDALPGIKVIQVIHITSEKSIEDAIDAAAEVDTILLDSGNQSLPVKILGGTGKAHDWSISKKIVEAVGIPVFLAGGLNPENITEAIEIVKPFGVDICSGVRTNGKLDESKLSVFINNVNRV